MFNKKTTIDKVPFWVTPFYYPIAFILGGILYLYWLLIKKTCKIDIKGYEHIEQNPSHIIAVWHRNGTCYWITRKTGKGYVELAHPIWKMLYPILVMRWSGAKVILGSTGHSGRDAANRIVKELKDGKSTAIAVDGPSGPIFKVKKGVLHMSEQSQRPIIPIVITGNHFFQLNHNWDKKRVPFPYSKIQIIFKDPIQVMRDNFEDSLNLLDKALGPKC